MTLAANPRTLVILDPAVEANPDAGTLAPRPVDRGRGETLNGLRVGLLDNVKAGADVFLDRVEARVRERYQPAEIVRHTKPQAGQPCPPAFFEHLATCDVVINAFGD